METTKETIEQLAGELELTMSAKFIPFSSSRNKHEKQPSLNWSVTIAHKGRPILTVDYSAGMAHCPSYKQSNLIIDREAVKAECQRGLKLWKMVDSANGGFQPYFIHDTPILPALADVLHSLASDSDALDYGSFESWASELGYDSDSRTAERTYRACLDIGLKLRAGLGESGLAKLSEGVSEY